MAGYFTDISDANTFFQTHPENGTWIELTDDQKTALLSHAYTRLRFHPDYSFPANPDGENLERLRCAQAETVLYMAVHLPDERKRGGLIAQKVKGAGFVKETYGAQGGETSPIPPAAVAILDPFRKGKCFFAAPIGDAEVDE